VGAHAHALGHTLPTCATVLAGVRGWRGDDSFASIRGFALEEGAERRPAGSPMLLAR
jgi:hypothetical protein